MMASGRGMMRGIKQKYASGGGSPPHASTQEEEDELVDDEREAEPTAAICM